MTVFTRSTPAQTWANNMLTGSSVILDTETTGFGRDAQIIQIAIIDMRGDTLFDSLLRPTCAIDPRAAAVHGLTLAMLHDAPTIVQVVEPVRRILEGRAVVIYNADFDLRMLKQTLSAFNLEADWVWALNTQSAMRVYSQLLGVSKCQRLEGGDHTAVGDCRACLRLIQKMAA